MSGKDSFYFWGVILAYFYTIINFGWIGFFILTGLLALSLFLVYQAEEKEESLEKKLELKRIHEENRKFEEKQKKERLNKEKIKQKIITNLIKAVNKEKKEIIHRYDNNGDGIVDEIEQNIFIDVLKNNQSELINIDKDKVHQFIKLSSYLKTKKSNIQSIYNLVLNCDAREIAENKYKYDKSGVELYGDDLNLEKINETINNEINVYKYLVFHSLNMITSLKNGDLLTFYEIYEMFDKLGVFNSNWENEVSRKLSNIESEIGSLIVSMNRMNDEIVGELISLNYTVESSIGDLEESVNFELQGIKSSVNFNNLLTSVNTYQLSKLNSKTNKLLNGR